MSKKKRLVLVGAGHAHAEVLRQWARYPMRQVQLVIASPVSLAPYSGMVPGWMAGMYRYSDICVPFAALVAAARARFAVGELHALDPDHRRLILDSGEVIDYDVLSLNVGSTITPPAVPAGVHLMCLRPLSRLRVEWDGLLWELQQQPPPGPLRVVTVGGGAAGVEATLAALHRLRALLPAVEVKGYLVTRSDRLLPDMARGAARAAQHELERLGVAMKFGAEFDPAKARAGDIVIWATGPEAHAWQKDPARRGTLAVSEQGYVRVDDQLHSVSHPSIFAVGDCAHWSTPLPKAGVFAVKQGPVLLKNLRAACGYGTPERYRPQSNYLSLLSLGEERAIGARGSLSLHGDLIAPSLWHWKDRIDQRFLHRYAMAKNPMES